MGHPSSTTIWQQLRSVCIALLLGIVVAVGGAHGSEDQVGVQGAAAGPDAARSPAFPMAAVVASCVGTLCLLALAIAACAIHGKKASADVESTLQSAAPAQLQPASAACSGQPVASGSGMAPPISQPGNSHAETQATVVGPPSTLPAPRSTYQSISHRSLGPNVGPMIGGEDGSGDQHVPVQTATAPALADVALDLSLERDGITVDRSHQGFLGKGGFASVYKGLYQGVPVAIKMVKASSTQPADLAKELKQLRTELTILSRVRHPNIVRLYGGCLVPPNFFLVEELMDGTLDKLIHTRNKHQPLPLRDSISYALDVATGLAYLHPTVVHRDLKPANILLSVEKKAKISDFGLARYKMKEYLSTKNIDAGTTAYIAPECFMSMEHPDSIELRQQVTHKTDMYALAVILWEMCTGRRPWQGLPTIVIAYQVALRMLRPPLPEANANFPTALQSLVQDCWAQDPKERPTSLDVVVRLQMMLKDLDEGRLDIAAGEPGSRPPSSDTPDPEVPDVDSNEAQRIWAQVLKETAANNKRAGPAELLAAIKAVEKARVNNSQTSQPSNMGTVSSVGGMMNAAIAGVGASGAVGPSQLPGTAMQGGSAGRGPLAMHAYSVARSGAVAATAAAGAVAGGGGGGAGVAGVGPGAANAPPDTAASLVTQEGVVMKFDF